MTTTKPAQVPAPSTSAGARARAALLSPIPLSLVGTFLLGSVILLGAGGNPLEAYAAIVTGAFGQTEWRNTLIMAVPVVGMGLAVAIPLRAGVVNLGGEGQIVIGGIIAALVATVVPLPMPFSLLVALVAAALAGGLLGAVPAVMENRLGVPLLVSSLLLSYPVVSLASYLVRFPLRDPGTGLPQTRVLAEAYRMPLFWGVGLSAVVLALVVLVVVEVDSRTPFGYEVRLTGHNRRFTEYAGIGVPRMVTRLMFTGGGVAGLVGAMLVTSVPYRYIDGALTVPGYTWTGLLAALLARAHPLGTVAAGVFFAALQVGGFGMERTTEVPRELSSILQATVIVILAASVAATARRPRQQKG
ncbi:MAG: ral nucleoside transport system permease protein [Blastococcus sp.]|nr:ral nucleoside transport system permease protein [Blastococcus sp.]